MTITHGVAGLASAVLMTAGAATPLASTSAAAAPVVTRAPAAVTATGDVRGSVTRIVDGDTIYVRDGHTTQKVRVIGVDTPEMPRGCYARQATAATTKLVAGRVVTLRSDSTQPNRDRYGRLLRHVVLPDGSRLAQRLIVNGYGREMPVGRAYTGRSAHLTAQKRAQSAQRGLWGACGATAVTRPTKPAPKQPVTTSGSCTIKGNISSSGKKIYHVPGGPSYAATKIDPAKGERWFCSTADAVRAGWRAARN